MDKLFELLKQNQFQNYFSGFAGKIQWTSLNPQNMLADMKSLHYQFPFDTIQQYMKRAGISTGYTEKPCLDPKDPLCPKTAPNKQSLKVRFQYIFVLSLLLQ